MSMSRGGKERLQDNDTQPTEKYLEDLSMKTMKKRMTDEMIFRIKNAARENNSLAAEPIANANIAPNSVPFLHSEKPLPI